MFMPNGTAFGYMVCEISGLARSRSENFAFEMHPDIRGQQPVVLRALGFVDHAEMGSYPEAVTAFLNGQNPRPDLTNHITRTTNWGVGLNGEATIPKGIRL